MPTKYVKKRKKPGPRPRPRAPLLAELHPWAPRYGLDKCQNPRCSTPNSPHHTRGYCATCHHKRLAIVNTRKLGPEGLRRRWKLLKRAYRARLKEQAQEQARLPGPDETRPPPAFPAQA